MSFFKLKQYLLIALMVATCCFSYAQQTVTSGNTTTSITFPGTCTYSWTNDNPSVGLAASGTGNIPSFTAVNNTGSSLTAHITATPVTGDILYVTNTNNNTLSVVDVNNRSIIGTIPVGVSPTAVVLSPDKTTLYVLNSASVSVISVMSNAVIKTIALPAIPRWLSISPDGNTLYTSDFANGRVMVVNINAGTVSFINNIANPQSTTVSTDGSQLYINRSSNGVTGSIWAYNTGANTLKATTSAATYGPIMINSPDGKLLYYSNGTDIGVMNTTTYNASIRLSNFYQVAGLALSADGKTLYESTTHLLYIINTSDFSESSFPISGQNFDLTCSTDGASLYASTQTLNTVSIIDLASKTVTSIPGFNGPVAIAVLPKGSGCSSTVYTLTVNPLLPANTTSATQQTVTSGNTTTPINLTGGCIYNWTNDNPSVGLPASGTGNIPSFLAINTGATPVTSHITATPLSGRAYITNNQGTGHVSVVDMATKTILATIPTTYDPSSAILSPDKTRVYVMNSMVGTTSITVINTADNSSYNIPLDNTGGGRMCISADGKQLYYTNYNAGTLVVLSTVTNTTTARIMLGGNPTATALSPDGRLLYVTNSNGNISVINTANNTVANTYSLAAGLINLVVNQNGSTLYVINSTAKIMSAINAATGATIASFSTGSISGSPIIISHDGSTVYFSNGGLVAVSTATNTVSKTYAIPSNNTDIAITDDDQYIYSTDYALGNVVQLNLATTAVVTFNGGFFPVGVALLSDNAACSPATFSITVNPALPSNTTSGSQTVNSGSATKPVTFGSCLYSWINDNPSIGMAASGIGNIPTFTATNTGSSNIVAHITATPLPGGLAYTGNPSPYQLSLVNVASKTITGTIGMDPNPVSLVFSPDKSKLYILNAAIPKTSLTVLNTVTNAIITTIPLSAGGGSPKMSISPDGATLYVVNYTNGIVSVINTITNSVTLITYVGGNPTGSVLSPDGSKLYVTDDYGFITVFNNPNTTLAIRYPVSAGVSSLAISPDGTKLYITNSTTGSVIVMNTGDGSIAATIPVGTIPNYIAINPNGKYVYAATRSNKLAVISTVTNTVIANVTIGPYPGGIDISDDGAYVYVTDFSQNLVQIISTASNTLITTFRAGNNPGPIATIPDGSTCGVVNYTITVNTAPAVIIASGTPAPLGTSFGTQSRSSSFTVSGNNLVAGILVTAPAGFEVSADNVNFSPTVTVGAAGTLPSTPVYIRLAKADNAGSYTGTINLTSAGATPVTVTMPSSTVSKIALDITGDFQKYYGESASNFTAYYYDAGTSDLSRGLANGNTFYSLDVALNSAASSPATPAGVYTNAVTFSNYQGANGFLIDNYTITYHSVSLTILPAALTINANNVIKDYGVTLISPGPGSKAFTLNGIQNSETVGTATITYGAGAAANALSGTYAGSVVPSALTGGTFVSTNYAITYNPGNLTVNAPPPPPVITPIVGPSAVNTFYGDPSGSSSFTVSAINLTAAILVTPPTGFEVSTDNITFSPTVSIGAAGSISNVPVYIRLAAVTDANTYSGNIILTTSGPVTANILMPNSTVTPAPLTVRANDVPKDYGKVLTDYTGTATGFYTITAGVLKNGNTIGTLTFQFGTGGIGPDLPSTYPGSVKISNVTGANGFKITNYNVSLQPGNIIINPVPLVINAVNGTKTYGDPLASGPGSTKFTPVGLVNRETIGSVTINYSNGSAATDAVGPYPGVITVSTPTGGTFVAAGYTISFGNAADLTVGKATLTVAAVNQTRQVGDPNPIFSLTYAGFVNNENESMLSVMPAGNSKATETSRPGKYDIIPGGGQDGNYDFIYVNGTLTVTAKPIIVLYPPNTFTPNGDGVNDLWLIKNVESYPKCTVDIFNRNGTKIFTSTGYTIPWDGTHNGQNVPTGTYYYIIDTKDGQKPYSGSITIIR